MSEVCVWCGESVSEVCVWCSVVRVLVRCVCVCVCV